MKKSKLQSQAIKGLLKMRGVCPSGSLWQSWSRVVKVVGSGAGSSWRSVGRSVALGSGVGLVLLNVFINDLDEEMQVSSQAVC